MILDGAKIKSLLRLSEADMQRYKQLGKNSIHITSSLNDFDPTTQIGNDSIDLRISNTGYVITNIYTYINTLLEDDFEKYFEKVELSPVHGYDLKPGELLFIDTLERIHLSGDLVGRVSGRSTFSRFGLSVHCTQEKFSSGINSVVALQIKNNTDAILKIFPYQKLAQIMIETTSHNPSMYVGSYKSDAEYKFPVIKKSDKEHYDARTKEFINRLKPKKNLLLKKHGKSAKLISLVQAILGGVTTVIIAVCGAHIDNSEFAYVILILVSILYIVECICFYILMDKLCE